MKAFLMYEDRDVDLTAALPPLEESLVQDLELQILLDAMAGGDHFLFQVAKRALLMGLGEPEAIVYRQRVLADCLENRSTLRAIYGLAVEAVQAEKRVWGIFSASPDYILNRSAQLMELFVEVLRRLRAVSDEKAGNFRSAGFVRFFDMLSTELDDHYFETVETHLRNVKFRHGALISAQLARGNTGTKYVLRRAKERRGLERMSPRSRSRYSFNVDTRDDAGLRELEDLRGRGINLVANALAQSADHILSFFTMLASELAFYIGCVNLYERVIGQGQPVCFPIPVRAGRRELSSRGLYDVGLTLRIDEGVVGNDVDAQGMRLIMITGANQGGKSTFLRALGQAQLMMQSGMFTPAEVFQADVCSGVFTHFKREEDRTMKSGKLEEELSRMSDIAEAMTPNSLLLCNESFAATNEREGSEIARQVISAMVDSGNKVVMVTHLHELSHRLHQQGLEGTMFLRAERRPDGSRTFKLHEGEPLSTSYGQDTYRRVFSNRETPDDGGPRRADLVGLPGDRTGPLASP
jgi:DNA mismatch repair ATPase MutS